MTELKCIECGEAFEKSWDERSFETGEGSAHDVHQYKYCKKCAFGNLQELKKIPAMYRKAKLSEVEFDEVRKPEILKRADEGGSFFLFAPVGVGKTHAAWAMINRLMWNTKSINWKFKTYEGLLREVRSTFGSRSKNESDIFEALAKTGTLVIDDLGGSRQDPVSAWSLSMIFEVINERAVNQRRVVITSNKNLDQLAKDFDDRISSRIFGMCKKDGVVEMKGEDRRVKI